ncbi:MAG: hypothetical protein IPO27_06925 [Bacteroidetes bacterium]|nr:hypothetical protein [Bacteroidota bacterium]
MKANHKKHLAQVAPSLQANQSAHLPWYLQSRFQYIIIALVCFAIYGITIMHEYALDDFIVIGKNAFTQKGFAGIKDILRLDTFAGMTEGNIQVLAGGRYRPLSVVTFAMEHSLFAGNPHIAHFINILLYALTCILLLQLLKQLIFPQHQLVAFASALLFAVHPLHTESVANVKGRDDILCLLLFLASANFLFSHFETRKILPLIFSVLFYFLSCMSKEFGVVLLFAFPLLFGMFYFKNNFFHPVYIIHLLAMLCFIVMRQAAIAGNGGTVSNDVFNNPFYGLSFSEKYGTLFYTWLLYFKNLFLPLNLSYDYNYAQIPYVSLTNLFSIVSILAHILLVIAAIYFYKKQNAFTAGVIFYFLTFGIVSNLVFNIGAPYADRFMFIPSVGFVIVVAALYLFLKEKLPTRFSLSKYAIVFAFLIMLTATVYAANRCRVWKDNDTLFLADYHNAPNSVKVVLNAGLATLNKLNSTTDSAAVLEQAKYYFQQGAAMKPDFADGNFNMGVIYNWQNKTDSAIYWWKKVLQHHPTHAKCNEYLNAYALPILNKGLQFGITQQYDSSIYYINKSIDIYDRNANAWANLGGAYYTIKNYKAAGDAWSRAIQLDANNKDANDGIRFLRANKLLE